MSTTDHQGAAVQGHPDKSHFITTLCTCLFTDQISNHIGFFLMAQNAAECWLCARAVPGVG